MRLENSFEVPVTVEDAWQVLLDVPRIAPCMPGATLTGTDGDEFTGTVKVKLGPITLTYQGKGRFVERDEAAHRVVIEASGKDSRSAGTAKATVTAGLTGQGDSTKVDVVTDLTVTGKPAQFGRGMIADVSGKLIGQFADCLAGELRSGATPAAPATPAASASDPESESGSESESLNHHGSAVERELTAAATAGTGAARTSPTGADPSGGTGSGAGRPTPAAPAPAATATTPRPVAAEAEPIDLLKLTSGSPAARRLAAIGAGALILAALAWLLTRRRRRVSRRS